MDKSDLARMPLPQLLELWEETTTNNSPCIPTVRGWLMDELESASQTASTSGWMRTHRKMMTCAAL